ncbi:hypothetical protein [Streptomyces profundus]|uniref:hypothetical protein n=1 Tax=Streptomyces profundus TaxID=2867410 RepID=UPI001D166441|nr:hypothetical protein [Streptomyces sp. MA3_2.13]UED83873.1 hypothetical protein K4G22_06310 [Streptomyces sp. MA3_2.13]
MRITFMTLSTTRDGHLLMVQGPDGWTLPNGTVPPGSCPVLTARQTLMDTTGYDRGVTDAYAISVTHTDPVSLTYVLDGGHTPTIPAGAHKHLPPNAGWLPLRELHEPPPIVRYALTAAAQRRRVPVLINGERPDAAYT